jgi:hypothetical protein
VRKDKGDRQLHDRRKPDRRAHIVGEDEEGGGEGLEVGQRHSVGDRAHRMLAHAEVNRAPARVVRLERAEIL